MDAAEVVWRTITYGEERIGFTVRFRPRPQRRVAIHVLPDGSVHVDAPESSQLAEVTAAVRQRARWIRQQLRVQRERKRHVRPREYVSGETHFYLGRQYMLKVQVDTLAPAGVRLWRGRLEVTTCQRAAGTVRQLLDAWYRDRARDVFERVLADVAETMRISNRVPAWRLLSMRTQWGSCSPSGELLLNPHLVKAPRACIEYVVAHELCHLREHNHSPRFYRLLGTFLPDWEARKAELDGMAEQLLNR